MSAPDLPVPPERVDERDTTFARMALVPGSPPHAAYYAQRPDLQPSDDRIRSKPGLLQPGGFRFVGAGEG